MKIPIHINLTNVDRFIDHADFFTLDVAMYIGNESPVADIEEFIDSCIVLGDKVEIPGIDEAIEITEELLKSVAGKYLAAVKEAGKITSISHKDSKEQLEEYFFGVLPDYDEDKVYASDIKKIIQWYNILQQNDLLEVLETETEEAPAIKKEDVAKKAAPKKAVNKSAAPKASATKKGGATKSASTRKV